MQHIITAKITLCTHNVTLFLFGSMSRNGGAAKGNTLAPWHFLSGLVARRLLARLQKPSEWHSQQSPGCQPRQEMLKSRVCVNSMPWSCFSVFQAGASRKVAASNPYLGTQPGSSWEQQRSLGRDLKPYMRGGGVWSTLKHTEEYRSPWFKSHLAGLRKNTFSQPHSPPPPQPSAI